MCLSGAREVQQKTLLKLKSDELRVFVVWLPRYNGDNRTKAVAATQIVSDPRARHFWDGDGTLGKRFGKVLSLPDSRDFAWDVYLAFDRSMVWDSMPPQPAYWMHQLGPNTNDKRRLAGETFRIQLERMLEAASDNR